MEQRSFDFVVSLDGNWDVLEGGALIASFLTRAEALAFVQTMMNSPRTDGPAFKLDVRDRPFEDGRPGHCGPDGTAPT